MLIDIRAENADTTSEFATLATSTFVDATSTLIGADKLMQLKHSDNDHLIVVRRSANANEVLGFASISITKQLFASSNETQLLIREALIKDENEVISGIIVQEILKMGRMMDARILCSDSLLSEAFPQALEGTVPCVTLRELKCLPS